MLELQRSALRNNLQIIVASHSPVILDSVPPAPASSWSVTRPRDRFAVRRCTATSFRRLCTASPETNSQCSVRMRLQKV